MELANNQKYRRKEMGRKFNFEFTPLTLDQLKEMSEEELYSSINKFKRLIREAHRAGRETLQFETEFCYLEHELFVNI